MRWVLMAAASLSIGSTAYAETTAMIFPVATITLKAGDTIREEHLADRRLIATETAIRGHVTSRAELVGKVARRLIPSGSAIAKSAVSAPYLFKDGDRVVLEYISGGLSIRVSGIALQPGFAGSSVRVRNPDSGTVVIGTVRGDGSVALGAD
jgi:flagellar basal body P-ring formation protein FlgA